MTRRILMLSCAMMVSLLATSCRDHRHHPAPVPFCATVTPDAGPLAGGNHVEITSGGICLFGPNTEVRFGGKPATILDIRGPRELVAEVPPGDFPGFVDVVIIGEDGHGNVCDCVQHNAYFYKEPLCLLVTPDAGPLHGGNHVEITSLGDCQFGHNTEILFGGKPATIIDMRSPTELVAEVPPGDWPGIVDVVLVGEDLHGNVCDCVQNDAYHYKEAPPVGCVAVAPEGGPLAGGNHVEITSLGDCLFGPHTEIRFGGKPATIIDILSPTELVAEVPPGDAPGLVDVVLIGEDIHGNVCDCVQNDAYHYKEAPPTRCVAVAPEAGPLAGGNHVEITSLGDCLFGPHTEIRFGGKPATIIDILSPTELVAEVPPGDAPGLVDVVLIGEDIHGNVCDCVENDAYLYKEAPPVGCVAVTPEAGPVAGGNHVEVTALGHCFFGPNTEIRFGGIPATIIDIVSPTELVAEVPPGNAPGWVDVVLIGEDGAGITCDCVEIDAYFYKEAPPVGCLLVSPDGGPLAGGNHVEVTSLGDCLFGPHTEIKFGGKPATIIDIVSPTKLFAEVPPGDAPGLVDVVLIGEDNLGLTCDCVQNDAYLYHR